MPITQQDLTAGAAEFVKKYNQLEELVSLQESRLRALISSASEVVQAQQAQATQVHHLCEDQACASCNAQGFGIADAAYEQGRVAAMEELDQWLLMAGGEEFRQKIIVAAAQGQKLYNESQQAVKVVA